MTIQRRRLRLAVALAAAAPLALVAGGCATAPAALDYAAERPALDLARYFDGPLAAHGVFTDRFGRVQRRFTVALVGRWAGDTGVLEEDFAYSDGTTERRVWRLARAGADGGVTRWRGSAADVVGTAEGEAAGNALRWRYTLALPVGGRTWHVDLDDWMWLVDERTLLNRAVMSKFGIRLGEVTIAFTKPAK
jgi:hypothetical protein